MRSLGSLNLLAEDEHMPEQRDRWSKLDIIAGILTPILIFSFGTIISIQQHRSDEAQKIADRVADLVKSLNSDRPNEQLTAIALLRLEKQRHPNEVPDELLSRAVPVLVNLAVNDRNAQVSQQAQQLVSEVATNIAQADPSVAQATQNVTNELKNIPARVYIQIGDEKQSDAAKAIQSKLRENDFNVPGIERVGNVPRATEVRYFRNDEKDEANRIVALLLSSNVPDAQAKYISGFENSKTLRPRQYEIWFSPAALGERTP